MTERIYPVIIHQFARRHNSGGQGRHEGGDGCIREIEFTTDLDVAILSQRRVIPPYGMAGGEVGGVGSNYWLKKIPSRSHSDQDQDQVEVKENSAKANGQTLHRKKAKGEYAKISLGGSNQCSMRAGDRILISEF